jgi:hypothetical protein
VSEPTSSASWPRGFLRLVRGLVHGRREVGDVLQGDLRHRAAPRPARAARAARLARRRAQRRVRPAAPRPAARDARPRRLRPEASPRRSRSSSARPRAKSPGAHRPRPRPALSRPDRPALARGPPIQVAARASASRRRRSPPATRARSASASASANARAGSPRVDGRARAARRPPGGSAGPGTRARHALSRRALRVFSPRALALRTAAALTVGAAFVGLREGPHARRLPKRGGVPAADARAPGNLSDDSGAAGSPRRLRPPRRAPAPSTDRGRTPPAPARGAPCAAS